jgi:hypothetical protein
LPHWAAQAGVQLQTGWQLQPQVQALVLLFSRAVIWGSH